MLLLRWTKALAGSVAVVAAGFWLANAVLERQSALFARDLALNVLRNLGASSDPEEELGSVVIALNEHLLRFGAPPSAVVDWEEVRGAALGVNAQRLGDVDRVFVLDIGGMHAAAAALDAEPLVVQEHTTGCLVSQREIDTIRRGAVRNYRVVAANLPDAEATLGLSTKVFGTSCGQMGMFTSNVQLGHARALAADRRFAEAREEIRCASLAVEREITSSLEWGAPVTREDANRYRAAVTATSLAVWRAAGLNIVGHGLEGAKD